MFLTQLGELDLIQNLIWTNWKNPFVAKNLSLSYGDFQDYKQIFLSEVLTRVRQTGQRFEG